MLCKEGGLNEKLESIYFIGFKYRLQSVWICCEQTVFERDER